MSKGTSIFYSFHEQGTPHVIAGIYVPHNCTEEEMRKQLLTLLGYEKFNDHETISYFNHQKVLAQYWLDDNVIADKETVYTLDRFFPEALEPENLPVSSFKFVYIGSKADQFIWRNRKHKEVNKFIHDLLTESSINRSNYKRAT